MTFEHPNNKHEVQSSFGHRATKGTLVLILLAFITFQVMWYYYGSEVVDVVEVEDVLVENKLCSMNELDQTRLLYADHMFDRWQRISNRLEPLVNSGDDDESGFCVTEPRIALYATHRTGTEYLQQLLDSHPKIDFASESFKGAAAANEAFSKDNSADPLEKLLKHRNGLVLPFGAFERTHDMLSYFSQNNWTVINLVRKNPLDQVILDVLDKSKESTITLPTGSALINLLVLLHAQRDLARVNLEEHSLHWIELNYEDLVMEPLDVACSLLLFAGCSCPALDNVLYSDDRINGEMMTTREAIVNNWAEVRRTLDGTIFERFAVDN